MTDSLNAEELYLVHLMSCALREARPMPLPEGVAWEGVYQLAISNSVATTCAIAMTPDVCPEAAERKRWRDELYKNGMRLALFEDERRAIFAQMDEAGLAHLPIKGVVMSGVYPRPEMRWMCDNDFLFGHDLGQDKVRLADDADCLAVRRIMEGRGYEVHEFGQSNHDAYEKAPIYNFEPHRMMAHNWEKWWSYYADPWARAHRSASEPGLAYEFSHEDVYIFHMAHMYKHFGHGGHGVRGIADEWVLLQAWGPTMDRTYLDAELAKLGMLDFDVRIRRICQAAVNDDACGLLLAGRTDALSAGDAETLAYMVESGAYGTLSNNIRNKMRAAEAEVGPVRARLRYMWRRLFPPLKSLKAYYPILERAPWLLPFVHIYRFTARLFKRRGLVRSEFEALSGKTGTLAPTDEKQ